jgi:glycosyltransferase involved in cell wall biosynthesis
MRVLHVTTNYPTASNPAFGIFMKEQVDSLEPLGIDNTVFFSNGSEHNQGKKYGGAIVHLKSVFKLQWHLLTHRYDIIHCHSNIGGLIVACSGAWMFYKCVLSFQNDPDQNGDGKLFKKLYPFFRRIIVKKPTRYLARKKVVYLPNGCNTDFFRPMSQSKCKQVIGLDANKDYILYVDSNTSRKRTQKRKDRFDEVLKKVREDYGHTNVDELVMIGIRREMVPTYMNACRLHLLTSDEEGSPNSVKESVFCNVPVVTTDVGNVEDMIGDIEGCYVSKSFSTDEIASFVHKVLTATEPFHGRDRLTEKGYDIETVAKKLQNIYNSI